MHQRSCRVIQGLNTELCTDIEEQSNFDTENIPEMVNLFKTKHLHRTIKIFQI